MSKANIFIVIEEAEPYYCYIYVEATRRFPCSIQRVKGVKVGQMICCNRSMFLLVRAGQTPATQGVSKPQKR